MVAADRVASPAAPALPVCLGRQVTDRRLPTPCFQTTVPQPPRMERAEGEAAYAVARPRRTLQACVARSRSRPNWDTCWPACRAERARTGEHVERPAATAPLPEAQHRRGPTRALEGAPPRPRDALRSR